MSTNYVVIGLGMGATGLILGWYSARWVMIGAAAVFGFGALASLLLTRWLPVTSPEEDRLLEAYGEAAAGELVPLNALSSATVARDPLPAARSSAVDATSGLERIAVLLEEIELRREREAARGPATRR